MERERGLVGGMVVGREPRRGAMRLADDDRAVIGVDEPGPAEFRERFRDAVVGDCHRERRLVPDAGGWRDRQLLPVACPGCARTVDLDGIDRQPDEIEVERRQVLGRAGPDGRRSGQLVGIWVVGEIQVVVLDVVPTVPVERVVGIADARCAGREHGWGRRPGQHERTQRDGNDEREPPSHVPSQPGLTVPPRVPGSRRAPQWSVPVVVRTVLPRGLCVTLQFRGSYPRRIGSRTEDRDGI